MPDSTTTSPSRPTRSALGAGSARHLSRAAWPGDAMGWQPHPYSLVLAASAAIAIGVARGVATSGRPVPGPVPS
ncbi:MAG: hypothetical protein U0802_12055 [Candidatus Binatia bacterium]